MEVSVNLPEKKNRRACISRLFFYYIINYLKQTNGYYMQEKDLEKFIVFVESMRDGKNDIEVDVIMEGFFNVYGSKNQFKCNDNESAMTLAMNNPGMLRDIWPKLYASNPEILMTALQHPDTQQAKSAYDFIIKFMKSNIIHKGKFGEIIEKGVQNALKHPTLKSIMQSFLSKRIRNGTY